MGRLIIIKPVSRNRDSWALTFQRMAKSKDDILLDKDSLLHQSNWDKEEWE